MSPGSRAAGGPRLVDSPRHALARRARLLERDRAARQEAGLYLAWGIHLAQEALAAGAPIRQALVGRALEATPEGRRVLDGLRRLTAPLAAATDRVLEGIVPGSADQGILLLVERQDLPLRLVLESAHGLVLAAHGVQDPGNLGSIVRTARAFGAGAVIALEGCADPFGSRAVRAAMGAHFGMPVVSATTAAFLDAAARAGLRLVAADPAGIERPTRIDMKVSTAVIVGNEGAGLPPAILQVAAARARIPMAAGVSSLNVHAAAAALLYEAWRQRDFAGDHR
jgi:TrmH family RNA methyltransferase